MTHAVPLVEPRPGAIGPLHGLRVVDLSRLVAGNMLSLQLADFGADVIKVEAAGRGDTLRAWRAQDADHPEGFDAWWQVYGRNKRSVALDLRDAEAMAWLHRLLATAQVLVESFRPGTLEAMGLAPARLHEAHPSLVIVRISGWGQDGPYSGLPGFGSLIEGFSGYAHKHRDGDGVPGLPNMALADMVTGLTGAFAVMAALRAVEVGGGGGQVIDLSLLEPMAAVMGPDVTQYAATGAAPPAHEKIASPRGAYRCRDGGWVSLSGSTQTMARRVFEALGHGALFDDPRFSSNAARLRHDAEVDRLVSGAIAQLDLADCLARFRGLGVTIGPIQSPAEILADPHVRARGVYVQLQPAGGGRPVTMHNVTPRLAGTPGALRRAAPALGEHTAEVLAELGADAAALGRIGAGGAAA
ncbi:CoA transferase [Aquincola sp. MAHUQ-54]|uniref:CoA transferase n=1 Tax=Aquincola agrisoli TaxID=3119538 RepID=A0AAW9QB11_9BURK